MTDKMKDYGSNRSETDKHGLREKLRKFSAGLPEEQRKAFRGIMGGASAVLRPLKNASADTNEGALFGQKLADFRDGLPPKQRDVFTSMVTAGALAWGVADGYAPEKDVQTTAMLHALLVPLAVITVGVVLIIDELSEDDVEPLPFPVPTFPA